MNPETQNTFMTNTKTKRLLALSLATLLAGAVTAVAIPQDGSLSFGVTATGQNGIPVTDNESTSWTGAPAALSLDASATAVNVDHPSSRSYEHGTATWAADGNSGTVTLAYGWDANDARMVATNGATDWSYTFTADATGIFSLNYVVVGEGDLFGLWGWNLSNNFDLGFGAPVTDADDPTTSGLFHGDVTAGNTYTVSLANNGNIGGDDFTVASEAFGSFQWLITPTESRVPDCSSTLLLMGLALSGLAGLRRMQRA